MLYDSTDVPSFLATKLVYSLKVNFDVRDRCIGPVSDRHRNCVALLSEQLCVCTGYIKLKTVGIACSHCGTVFSINLSIVLSTVLSTVLSNVLSIVLSTVMSTVFSIVLSTMLSNVLSPVLSMRISGFSFLTF